MINKEVKTASSLGTTGLLYQISVKYYRRTNFALSALIRPLENPAEQTVYTYQRRVAQF
jgi:hypothetical protein